MPNHITNWLALRGPAQKLDTIEQTIKDGCFLDYCFPIPSGYKGEYGSLSLVHGGPYELVQQAAREKLRAMYGMPTVLDWATRHWGTKWDIYSVVTPVRLSPTQLIAKFDTAWAQPSGALARLLDDDPELALLCLSEDEGGWPVTAMWGAEADGCDWASDEDVVRMTLAYAQSLAEQHGWTEEVNAMAEHYGFSTDDDCAEED